MNVDFLALESDPVEAWKIGLKYEHGSGVEKDIETAAKLYKIASDKSIPTGQILLGRINEGKEDFQSAADLYMKASESGDPNGQLLLARLYQKGIGVSQNPEIAADLLKKSADQQNPLAQLYYSQVLFDGIGVEKKSDISSTISS